MDVLSALADDTRRQMVERLARGDLTAGELGASFAISQPGVSRHLRVLREAGLAEVRPRGQERVYRLVPAALDEVERWLSDLRAFWTQRLDALGTEIERGKRERRQES